MRNLWAKIKSWFVKPQAEDLSSWSMDAQAFVKIRGEQILAGVIADTHLVSTLQNKINSSVITRSSTAPTSPATDDLWIDTSVTPNKLKRWDTSLATPDWVDIGASGGGGTAVKETIYTDANGVNKYQIAYNATTNSLDIKYIGG